MYFRRKTSAGRAYLQIVESRRDGDQVRQQVIATLGRFEDLQASGQLERLVRSGARFAAKAMVLSAASNEAAIKIGVRRIGPALVFERLWEETGCRAVITALAGQRKHGFALERAVFLTVLHRLFMSGSDRAADRWREDYAIVGVAGLDLHHLYRAMAWLGEELPEKEQDGRTPFSPRCLKDVVEERLFAHRRDLLTRLDLVFMDTTSLYFEGAGGQTLGQHGYSKDRDRLYNVAKLDFEWSSIIERRGRRRQPLLVAVGPKQDTSQFVAGDSESTQDLMHHRRPAAGPVADGGAHGPAHGSPSAASARIIRSDKIRPPASDRGLCSSRAGRTTLEKTAKSQRCATAEAKMATVTARGGDT